MLTLPPVLLHLSMSLPRLTQSQSKSEVESLFVGPPRGPSALPTPFPAAPPTSQVVQLPQHRVQEKEQKIWYKQALEKAKLTEPSLAAVASRPASSATAPPAWQAAPSLSPPPPHSTAEKQIRSWWHKAPEKANVDGFSLAAAAAPLGSTTITFRGSIRAWFRAFPALGIG